VLGALTGNEPGKQLSKGSKLLGAWDPCLSGVVQHKQDASAVAFEAHVKVPPSANWICGWVVAIKERETEQATCTGYIAKCRLAGMKLDKGNLRKGDLPEALLR